MPVPVATQISTLLGSSGISRILPVGPAGGTQQQKTEMWDIHKMACGGQIAAGEGGGFSATVYNGVATTGCRSGDSTSTRCVVRSAARGMC